MSKFVLLAFVLAIAGIANANAQAPAPAAPSNTYVLIPYDQPDGKDEHASAVMSDLSKDFEAAHVTVTTAPPIDHLEAVEHAASLCAQYHANGLLIAEGRDEQTMKAVYAVLTTVIRYPTHVEFRLDEIGCDGVGRPLVEDDDRRPQHLRFLQRQPPRRGRRCVQRRDR
ncbi:MAG TPA: hypothetical protein VIK27_04670 [Candidatus Aquilonibacter sp.]